MNCHSSIYSPISEILLSLYGNTEVKLGNPVTLPGALMSPPPPTTVTPLHVKKQNKNKKTLNGKRKFFFKLKYPSSKGNYSKFED